MQDPGDPRSWLHHWPDIAAGAAGTVRDAVENVCVNAAGRVTGVTP
jgi:hypothetical protein